MNNNMTFTRSHKLVNPRLIESEIAPISMENYMDSFNVIFSLINNDETNLNMFEDVTATVWDKEANYGAGGVVDGPWFKPCDENLIK